MKSHELAALGGVTVRALRHYHQVGVLPEPQRGSNGYRDYTVHDLVRLLRVKRLAALGIPLERMPEMLDGEPAAQEDLLDSLDRDIDAEIERLRAQQSLIRLIRANQAAPDFPPQLARFFALFGGDDPTTIGRVDREQAILLAHLVGEAGTTQLAALYESIAETVGQADIERFVREFEGLDASAGDAEIDELVERFAASMRPVLARFAETGAGELPNEKQALALLGDHQRGALNAAQETSVQRLVARLS
jgi:DNA-binding transcriptional MerR regulator